MDGKPAYNSIPIAECTYDAETGVYTLKATNDYTYTVKVTDGVATVTAEANAKEEARIIGNPMKNQAAPPGIFPEAPCWFLSISNAPRR